MEIYEVVENPNDLSGAELDDIAREYKKYLHDLEELKAYGEMLKAELANRSLDKERKILPTSYGVYRGRWQPGSRKWDRAGLAREVARLAVVGELHSPNKDGELPGTSHSRVLDAIERVFLLEPRSSQVKKIGLNVDEYSEESTQGKWTISIVAEGKDK